MERLVDAEMFMSASSMKPLTSICKTQNSEKSNSSPFNFEHHPWRYQNISLQMEFLIRFVQIHETFRKPEIEALAVVQDVDVEFLTYAESVSLSVAMS